MEDNRDNIEAKDKYADLYDFAPIGYFTLSQNQLILESNLTGAALLGIARDELIKQEFKKFVAPADIELWDKHITGVCQNGAKQSCDLRIGRPDGFVFYGQITSVRMELPAVGDQPPSFALRTMMTDITIRKRMEEDLRKAYKQLKETQQALIQSEKMSALGRFSILIAHEVKNPMGIMLGGLEFLETKLPHGDDDAEKTIKTVKDALLRANFILESLLHYAHPADLKLEAVNASDIVKIVLDMVTRKASLANITIDTEIAQGLQISVDKNQMHQALFNIVMNAMEAMPNGGKISFKTYKAIIPELSSKDMSCVIEVDDTGSGISQENLTRLAEPFFTTKVRGVGTGLGFFITKMVVENHKGKLLIESSEGKGTAVKIVLPLVH